MNEDERWERLENRIAENRPKLKQAKNIRVILPRVCATCHHWLMAGGAGVCERKNGFSCDAGDLLQWTTTCDRYKRNKNHKA